MSMTDVESPQDGRLNHCYRNELPRHTQYLPSQLVQRLRRTAALIIRQRCPMTLGEDTVSVVIEAILEQCGPWIWRIHGQHAGPCEYIDPVRLAQWRCARTDSVDGLSDLQRNPNQRDRSHAPVLELIARALHEGEEGHDWRMLRRLPVDATTHVRSAA